MPQGAPTTEKGTVRVDMPLPGWGSFGQLPDEREYVPDLRFPTSIKTYEKMENDAQLNGLLIGTMLPIRRFRWEIVSNDARPEIVKHVASDMRLPIRGEDPGPVPRRKGRFSFDQHLPNALRHLVYGFYPFEQVAPIGDDGLAHLKKLAPRPPRTVSQIEVAPDGGLMGVKQAVGLQVPQIEVGRLVFYCWDRDGANWYGRSMLRAVYKNWLIKDRLLRVDALKHERNGMGIPWFKTDPNLSQPQVDALAATAAAWRAGEEAGGAGPGDFSLVGTSGSIPNTVESWKAHNAEMAKNFLMMFFELGQSETGSRALGGSFIDFFSYSQEAIADHICDTFNEHVVEDLVDWNWGPDEQAPLLAYRRQEGQEYSARDLSLLVASGAVEVDDELEDVIRERGGLPDRSTPRQVIVPTKQPQPGQEAGPAAAEDEDQQSVREVLSVKLLREASQPAQWPELARAVGRSPKDGTARRARDQLIEAGQLQKLHDGRLAVAAEPSLPLPDRELRRQPYPAEVQASVNFAAMESLVVGQRTSLLGEIKAAQASQVEAVVAQISDAGQDIEKLAALSVDPIDSEIIAKHMRAAAEAGYNAAEQEAKAQGVQAAAKMAVDTATEQRVSDRAKAYAATLAGALREVASRKALALSGGALAATEVADQVRQHIDGLSDAFLDKQANGAVMEGMNTGRKDYMTTANATKFYASELLDERTCGPCTDVDGTDYATMAEAEGDYPLGGYMDCAGELLCRGTLVATYGTTE